MLKQVQHDDAVKKWVNLNKKLNKFSMTKVQKYSIIRSTNYQSKIRVHSFRTRFGI